MIDLSFRIGRMPTASRSAGRRAEYAELTRRALVDAARTLFTAQGYFATRVEQIADMARVAPATVYAVGGGKSGLLHTLIKSAVTSEENAQLLAQIEAAGDPEHLIRFVIAMSRTKFEKWSPLMRQVVAAAAQDRTVRESMEIAHESLLRGLRLTADRLAAMGALRDGMDAAEATDVLWMHLCNAAYFIRTDDLGWSLDRSQTWLDDVLPHHLLRVTAPDPGRC
jgi:AcrR family transcriptional regulator